MSDCNQVTVARTLDSYLSFFLLDAVKLHIENIILYYFVVVIMEYF